MGAGFLSFQACVASICDAGPEIQIHRLAVALQSVNALTPVYHEHTCCTQSALFLPSGKTHYKMQREVRTLLTGYKDRTKETRYP